MLTGDKEQEESGVSDGNVHYHGGYACEFCGRLGAQLLGGRHVCEDCSEGMASCCPEFGMADLWPNESIEEAPGDAGVSKNRRESA